MSENEDKDAAAERAFGAEVRGWREAAGLSRSEVERRCGRSKNWLLRVEEEGVVPPPADVDRIARAIGIARAVARASALAAAAASNPWVAVAGLARGDLATTHVPAPSAPFGSWLMEARAAKRLSQEAVDTRLGKGRGHIAQIETGRVKPPGRADCETLAAVFGVDAWTLWDVAARERCEWHDPDLLEWADERVNRAVRPA